MLNLSLIHFFVLLSAILVVLLGVFIYFKLKDTKSKYFLFFSFSVALWCVTKIISFAGYFDVGTTFFIYSFLYFIASFTSVAFFLFSSSFSLNKIGIFGWLFAIFSTLLMIFISFTPGFLIRGVSIYTGEIPVIDYNKTGAILYAIVFFATYLTAYFLLIIKYFKSKNKTEKFQTLYIAFATLIPPLLGFLTNLVMPMFFNNFSFQWAGQLSVSLAVLIVAYGITKYSLFEFRMFLSEIFVLSFWVLALFQFSFVKDKAHFLLNIIHFFISIIFGYFILKLTQNELNKKQELEKLAKKLKRANNELKKLDKAKTEFLSLATHQLRTPLASIIGYSSMLLEGDYGNLPNKAKDILGRILKSARFMANTITDFLDVSRIEIGSVKYEKEKINTEELITNILNDLYPKIKKAGLSVIVEPCKNKCKPIIYVDKVYIKHVFMNLIENAIKYTPKGYVKISAYFDENKKIVKISIKDTGIGISKKDIKNIFKKFTRAENAIKYKIHGSGLGLYVVKNIVKDHGGNIYVKSKGVGKGSEFIVELPVFGKYCKNK